MARIKLHFLFFTHSAHLPPSQLIALAEEEEDKRKDSTAKTSFQSRVRDSKANFVHSSVALFIQFCRKVYLLR